MDKDIFEYVRVLALVGDARGWNALHHIERSIAIGVDFQPANRAWIGQVGHAKDKVNGHEAHQLSPIGTSIVRALSEGTHYSSASLLAFENKGR